MPDAHDISHTKAEKSIRIEFSSKNKDFSKTYQKKARDYYFIDIEANVDDIEDVDVHTVS